MDSVTVGLIVEYGGLLAIGLLGALPFVLASWVSSRMEAARLSEVEKGQWAGK